MPIESEILSKYPYVFEKCPKCGASFPEFMRGQVQRNRRFLWILWNRPYCAVICHKCNEIIGWEEP
jgi:predicted nucleic-acid-binding Zn-ribbon protein